MRPCCPARHFRAQEFPLLQLLLVVISSYLLGCIVGAYYLVRLRKGVDVRTKGSGTAGARNALRVAGMRMAIYTFAFDLGKGALAVWIASQLVLRPWAGAVAFACVIVGHLWPAQLSFRGGKGIAPGLGGMLIFAPMVTILVLSIGAILGIVVRGATEAGLWLAGLSAVALTTPIMAMLGYSPQIVAGVAAGCTMILVAHHPIFERMHPRVPGGKEPAS